MPGETKRTTPTEQGIPAPEYRLSDRTHVGAVQLQVSDLPRSLAYYEQVIGLRPIQIEQERATLGSHEDEKPLVVLHTRRGLSPARRGALGLFHFALLLPERAALGQFAAHAASLGIRIAKADHLVSEALYLWDPDGLGIEVYADRPKEAWQWQDREVAMATDPLDLAGLIAAGRGAQWSGMPRGAAMGHVHLHVGRLDDAEAFYHRALGLDKTVWTYPGALFLSAGGYHHHLAVNVWSPGPPPSPDEAQLLEWELLVPSANDVAAVGQSLEAAGFRSKHTGNTLAAADPWGTMVRIRSQE